MRNEHNKRVAIYLRLSDEDKDKTNKLDDSESIKNQRNLLLDEINKRKDFILIDEYCDEDLSGAGTYRPEFERLIKDCEKGLIDIVLCKSQSRFSRDMEIIEKYLHNKFIEWNIRFIGLADNADTNEPGNKKSRQINGLVNEWYLEDTSNNIRSAFKAKMKEGEFISPFAAFGYEISKENNNKLIIDPYASLIVKEIFKLYLTGYGYTGIAKYLNDKKIPCPSLYKYQKGIKLNVISKRPRTEIKWNPHSIKTILTNELYIGNLVQGKRTTISYKNHKVINKPKDKWIRRENTHEAIIDEDIFNKVKDAMAERTKPTKTTRTVHIFSGKVYCKECNHHMRKKNSSKHIYLVCQNSENSNCSNTNSIRYDELEKIILYHINELVEKYYDINLLNNISKKEKDLNDTKKLNTLIGQVNELKNKISKSDNYIKSLYEDKVNKIISQEQFKDLIKIYNDEKYKIKDQLKYINNEIKNYKQEELSNKKINRLFNKYSQLEKLNRIVIEEFIDNIYISNTNKEENSREIEIKWNF